MLPSLGDLIIYIQQKICAHEDRACHASAASLDSAHYLDIDYDAISQALVLNAFRSQSPSSRIWNEKIQNLRGSTNLEVGVLANEVPTKPEELSLGGFLTVVGEDEKPSTSILQSDLRQLLSCICLRPYLFFFSFSTPSCL